MFHHIHPYEVFIPKLTEMVIVGTLPPPRFTTKELKERDVDFCYGSQDGTLWSILDTIFELGLLFDNSQEAVQQRKDFLIERRLGICDIVASCKRKKIDSSDLGMQQIVLRDILGEVARCSSIHTLLFMGGNSKNGPEYLFRQVLKRRGLKMKCAENKVPRIHHFQFESRDIRTVSFTSPSNAVNRAIGSTTLYKTRKQKDPSYTTFDYRVEQYREIFT